MNHTPEKSGAADAAGVFGGFGCGAVWAKRTSGKARAAAAKIEMMQRFRTVVHTPNFRTKSNFSNPEFYEII
jgi:hypothetical protein